MTSVNRNSYISHKRSVFGQRLKNSAENKCRNMTYSTSNNPIYSNNNGTWIALLHVTGTYRWCHFWFICWNVSLRAAEKAFKLLFKKQIRQNKNQGGKCDSKCGSGVTSWGEQPNSPRLIRQLTWSDLMWRCDVIHTSEPGSYERGASYIHRRTTGRVWPFLIQRQFFTLITFCPLTWQNTFLELDEIELMEAQRPALLENWEQAGKYLWRKVLWLLHVQGKDPGSSACAQLGLKTSDFCVVGKKICHFLTCLDLWPVHASWLGWANVGHSRPSCLSCKSKHLLP